ncbi:unnamed protein product [Parajaminaea phylloscopi]
MQRWGRKLRKGPRATDLEAPMREVRARQHSPVRPRRKRARPTRIGSFHDDNQSSYIDLVKPRCPSSRPLQTIARVMDEQNARQRTVAPAVGQSDTEPVAQPSQQPASLGQHILDSLFSPGLNTPTRNLMNYSFYGLFFTLLGLALITGGNIHVLFLLAVAIALWLSVNWFLHELAKMPSSVRETQQIPTMPSAEMQDSKSN